MGAGATMLVVIGSLPMLTGVGVVVAGLSVMRRTRRDHARRVPVAAVVVHHSFGMQPASVTFDYPTPAGWVRATRVVGAPVEGTRSGTRITVWMDPVDPRDITLGTSSGSSLAGVLVVAGGTFLTAIGLGLVLRAAFGGG